jgi:ubiquinone/menaquinone biosynthesis C-methylase UbiE
MQDQLQAPDVYGRTFQLDHQTLEVIAARLEARGRHSFFIQSIEGYLARLSLTGTERVLDFGCGTGIVARTLAKRVGFTGDIAAIDISEGLVAIGRRYAEAEGVGHRITYRSGDAHFLDIPDGDFDIIIAHTLISHVADPVAVLLEARRMLQPGGRVVVFDGDYASFTFTTDDPDHGKAMDEALAGSLVAQPRVMRIMPRLIDAAGLSLIDAYPSIVADIGQADFFAAALPSFRVLLPKAGLLNVEQTNRYIDGLEKASAEGRFFGASNFYTYIARRPQKT